MCAVGTITRWVTVCLAVCLLVLPAQAWHHPSDPAGTWKGHAPAADAARRVFTLQLAQDGTAVWDTLYIGKDSVTQHGRWTRSGRQITLTFDAVGSNKPPQPITFRFYGEQLHPVQWDKSEWGKAGPPALYRSNAANQGGL
jgi:hypothetical protein